MRIDLDQARQLGQDALRGIGFDAGEAATIMGHLLDCELRGLEYAGLARILSIADRLDGSPPSSDGTQITRESPVSAQLDGGDRVGYLVSEEATRLAIDKAKQSGIGAVGASNTWYTGMLSYYTEKIVAEGLVAMIASNATPWVAPFGGTEPMFGTNPICFGFPSRGTPIIWDIGISEIIHAQTVIAHRTGQDLPSGVAYDPEGNPTVDPVAALSGAFVNWGGHRGSGLGIVVQLLGVLAGSPALPGELQDFGFFVIAVRPDLFVDEEEFRDRVAGYADAIRGSRPLEPNRPVRVPFERSAALRAERISSGSIDVDDVVYQGVLALAGRTARP